MIIVAAIIIIIINIVIMFIIIIGIITIIIIISIIIQACTHAGARARTRARKARSCVGNARLYVVISVYLICSFYSCLLYIVLFVGGHARLQSHGGISALASQAQQPE